MWLLEYRCILSLTFLENGRSVLLIGATVTLIIEEPSALENLMLALSLGEGLMYGGVEFFGVADGLELGADCLEGKFVACVALHPCYFYQ